MYLEGSFLEKLPKCGSTGDEDNERGAELWGAAGSAEV